MKPSYLILALAMLLFGFALQPQAALAQTASAPLMPPACAPLNMHDENIRSGATIASTGHYSYAVVHCIETSVKTGVVVMLQILSDYMAPVVAALCTLGIMFFGVRVMAGESQLGPQSLGMALRIALVIMFSYNLGKYAGYVFDVLDQMLALVTSNNRTCTPYPWCGIDNFLGKLLGFGKDQQGKAILLFNGILGLLGGSLFSSAIGFMLFMIGITTLISIILFVFEVVYLYLTSIVVVGFLIVISPIVIPFAIFRYGERYFQQWLRILLSAMLVPVMVYAFLWVFLSIFDDILSRIFDILGGNDNLRTYLNTNRPILSWLMPTDPNTVQQLGSLGEARPEGVPSNTRLHIPPVQTFTDPNTRYSMDSNAANPPMVDFGPNDGPIKQTLIYEFISLWIFATLMKSTLSSLPGIASQIAGAGSGITLGMSSMQQTVAGFNDKLRTFGQGSTTPRPEIRR